MIHVSYGDPTTSFPTLINTAHYISQAEPSFVKKILLTGKENQGMS